MEKLEKLDWLLAFNGIKYLVEDSRKYYKNKSVDSRNILALKYFKAFFIRNNGYSWK